MDILWYGVLENFFEHRPLFLVQME